MIKGFCTHRVIFPSAQKVTRKKKKSDKYAALSSFFCHFKNVTVSERRSRPVADELRIDSCARASSAWQNPGQEKQTVFPFPYCSFSLRKETLPQVLCEVDHEGDLLDEPTHRQKS